MYRWDVSTLPLAPSALGGALAKASKEKFPWRDESQLHTTDPTEVPEREAPSSSSTLGQGIAPYGATLAIPMRTINSNCTQDGIDFENAVIAYEALTYGSQLVARNVPMPEIGIEVDMILKTPVMDGNGNCVKTITKYVQTKGGRVGLSKKPGAKRTDSVKKGIADGALFKSAEPNEWFTLYFSDSPSNGSASEAMINAALDSGIVDEVKYIGYRN